MAWGSGSLRSIRFRARISRSSPASSGATSPSSCPSICAGTRWADAILNDLLPLPFTEEALDHVCARIDAVQHTLGRRILVENISSYIRFRHSTIPEWDFLVAMAERTGCGILLDINNVFVGATNHGFDARTFLSSIPPELVGELHLAGFEESEGCLVDTHSRPVCEAVWQLYRETIARIGPRPTLIEWDKGIPPLDDLLDEARKAQGELESVHAVAV